MFDLSLGLLFDLVLNQASTACAKDSALTAL